MNNWIINIWSIYEWGKYKYLDVVAAYIWVRICRVRHLGFLKGKKTLGFLLVKKCFICIAILCIFGRLATCFPVFKNSLYCRPLKRTYMLYLHVFKIYHGFRVLTLYVTFHIVTYIIKIMFPFYLVNFILFSRYRKCLT